MHCSAYAIVFGLAALLWSPTRPVDAVSAQPNPVPPGRAVTFRWFFTGDKVVVSGGRFGKGTVVTGKQSITDHPRTTTRYVFEVWYTAASPGGAAASPARSLHARYPILVTVRAAVAAPLSDYRDARGWGVCYVPGWKHDVVPLPDPARNALVYFQPEDDSIERLAVSILPAAGLTAVDLMKKAQITFPTYYEDIQGLTTTPTEHAGVPAVLTTFSGMDVSHPGTRTQSLVLVFVRRDLGYVISARTAAATYPARREVLERLVRSFKPGSPALTSSTSGHAQP